MSLSYPSEAARVSACPQGQCVIPIVDSPFFARIPLAAVVVSVETWARVPRMLVRVQLRGDPAENGYDYWLLMGNGLCRWLCQRWPVFWVFGSVEPRPPGIPAALSLSELLRLITRPDVRFA